MNIWRNILAKGRKEALFFAASVAMFIIGGTVAARFQRQAILPGEPEENRTVTQAAPELTPNTKKSISGTAFPGAFDTDITAPAAPDERDAPLAPEASVSEVVVYITGYVRRPGVYRLPEGSRLLELVEAAGGLSMTADPAAVNLAALLEDGMHVHAPGKGDKTPPPSAPYIGLTPYVVLNGPTPGQSLPDAGPPMPVDVNRATADELTALKGIGPALASAIVEYRLRHGRFGEPDDLLRVRGIGRKKLEQFRDSIVIVP